MDPACSDLFIPPYPKNQVFLEWEVAELAYLQRLREDPDALAGAFDAPPPAIALPDDYFNTTRTRISEFALIQPLPFSSIVPSSTSHAVENAGQQHLRRDAVQWGNGAPMVATGRQLARLFERETPGLLHHHALNYLFSKRPDISPPRQARVWMALDLAIYSALGAAWHYKWAADPTAFSFRQRPVEFDRGSSFQPLFDTAEEGDGGDGSVLTAPQPSPGTPRSPSYPSGHAAYAWAASEMLAYFFPEEREEFEILANNIGTARLWAGVNWRSDCAAGQRLGRAVARRMVEQMEGDCVPAFDDPAYSQPDNPVPDPSVLRLHATERRSASPCPEGNRHDTLTGQRRIQSSDDIPNA